MTTECVQFPSILTPREPAIAGTLFGSSEPMPLPAPRRRDRRRALGDLLAALTRLLDRRLDVSLMRGSFEATLRRALPVRTIHLREGGNRWPNQAEAISAPESIALEVPGGDPDVPGVLEATFDPGSCLGEWDFQLLGLAAHVGALVLEIERSRLQLARVGLLGARPAGPHRGSPRGA